MSAPANTAGPEWAQRLLHGRTVEEGECLLWTGVMCNHCPAIFLDGRYQMVRRLLWSALRGRDIPRGLRAVCCGEPRCVAPAHLRVLTPQQISREVAEATGWPACPLRRAKIARARRAASTKLDEEKVARVRAAPSGAAAARELGISRGMANRIRAGKAWAPLCAPSSVWSWRP